MEASQRGRVGDKRSSEENVEEDDNNTPDSKKPKLTSLASVIVEALKVDSLQRLCSSLEPMLRRIVSEEVERALTKMGNGKLIGRSAPPKLQGPQGRNLQLKFRTRMPPHLFTGGKIEGEQGATVHVVLLDAITGCVVQTRQESGAKLNVVVLEGDFNEEVDEDWTADHFESHEVKEREGKRPLLTGDLQVVLKEGVGTLGDLTFTDNSSWIRSRKFRLGVKVASGFCEGTRVREGKTEAFAVKDHRGELYKKHYPPALQDEVWRLDRIAKDGALHKRLVKAQIVTVEDFLRLLHQDPQKLRSILGSGMSNRMWENTVEHAKTCVLGGKLYVYYADGMQKTGVVFNHIYELRGLIDGGQFLAVESLNHNQKISVDTLVKQAYENWHRVIEYDGKVLNSITGTKNGKSASRLPIADKSYNTTNYVASSQITQQYIPAEPSLQTQAVNNNSLVPQLIEFPFVRSEKNAVITPNNPHTPSISNVDFMQVRTPALSEPYFTGDWSRARSGQGHGLEDSIAEEIHRRSSEMLEAEDMQRLLRTFNIGGFGQSNDACYSYNVQAYDPQMNQTFAQDQGRIGSGKAVVGWLKLKAALRWGIFIRKKAAERRAQLVELD